MLFCILTDVDASRLEFARNVGATHTVLVERGETEESAATRVAQALGGQPDRTIECSGAQFSVNLGVYV